MLSGGPELIQGAFAAPSELLRLAREQKLWTEEADRIQLLISLATGMAGYDAVLLLKQIGELGGSDQKIAFQLLGTHFQVQAILAR